MLGNCGTDARLRVMTGDEIESSDEGDGRDAYQDSFSECRAQSLLSLGNWIALIHPICAEIVSDVKHLDVGEAHPAQRIVGRLDVRTMAPGATTTIDHDELLSGQRLNACAQLLEADLAGTRTDVLGTGNMCLLVQNVGADLDHQRLFALRGLKDFDKFVGIDQLRTG